MGIIDSFITMAQPKGSPWVPEYAILPGMLGAFALLGCIAVASAIHYSFTHEESEQSYDW
jgi:hypothetical protein